ncbi:MAG TPA: twin-arginine translocase TatA/TatE family subunit [Lacipirellulaceae bacterium]|jgi:sec-independent protein translocase protein TatA
MLLLANFLSPIDMLIVGIVAVMLFGNRLPEVARSLGRSLNEFKKGMREFENEVKTSIYSDTPSRSAYQDRLPSPSASPAAAAPSATVESPPNEPVNS